MGLTAAACGSSTPATPAAPAGSGSDATSAAAEPAAGGAECAESSGPVTLTFATWVKGMDQIAAMWNADNPDIQVQVQEVPSGNSGTYQNFTNALKAGTAPDLAQIEYDSLPNFRIQDGLADISGCPGVADAKSSFVDWTWGQVDFAGSGGVWAIPQDAGPMAMYYRSDIFEELGIAAPTTWAEYAEAAAKIHADDPTRYITFFSQSDPNWYTGLLWQNGAKLFSTEGDAIKVSIGNNPQVQEVDAYWQDLIDKELVATNLQGFSPDLYKAWNDGSVVTWISAAWGYSTIRDNAADTAGKWAVAPMPQWEAGQQAAGNWGGSSTAVLSSSKNPAAAAKFALWLNTDPEALAMGNELGGLYPAAVAGADIPALQAGVPFYGDEKIFDVFKTASENVDSSFVWGPTMTDTYNAMKDGVVAALGGSGTLDDAMTSAQAKTVASLTAQNIPVAE